MLEGKEYTPAVSKEKMEYIRLQKIAKKMRVAAGDLRDGRKARFEDKNFKTVKDLLALPSEFKLATEQDKEYAKNLMLKKDMERRLQHIQGVSNSQPAQEAPVVQERKRGRPKGWRKWKLDDDGSISSFSSVPTPKPPKVVANRSTTKRKPGRPKGSRKKDTNYTPSETSTEPISNDDVTQTSASYSEVNNALETIFQEGVDDRSTAREPVTRTIRTRQSTRAALANSYAPETSVQRVSQASTQPQVLYQSCLESTNNFLTSSFNALNNVSQTYTFTDTSAVNSGTVPQAPNQLISVSEQNLLNAQHYQSQHAEVRSVRMNQPPMTTTALNTSGHAFGTNVSFNQQSGLANTDGYNLFNPFSQGGQSINLPQFPQYTPQQSVRYPFDIQSYAFKRTNNH